MQTWIITTYTKLHQKIRKILARHWHFLRIDPVLNQFVSKNHLITFRQTKSLKDMLVHSEYTGEFRGDPCKRKGMFRCGGCAHCQFMNTDHNQILPSGQKYRPSYFAYCQTAGVVYLLTYPCGCFYVGKTKLEFHKRVYRHVLSMRTCNPDLPLGRHVRDVHQGKFPSITFLVLDRVHPSARGGDWDKTLLQRETRWIVTLWATSPPGLIDLMGRSGLTFWVCRAPSSTLFCSCFWFWEKGEEKPKTDPSSFTICLPISDAFVGQPVHK